MDLMQRYGIVGALYMIICLLRTKFFYPKSRIIRFPFDIRGRRNIDLGKGLTTGKGCRIEAFSEDDRIVLSFGKNVQINDYVHISAMRSVVIGDGVLMAGKIYISDNSHGFYKEGFSQSSPEEKPIERAYFVAPVSVEDNVWIGEGVVVMPGVSIGKGCIVGANSVVTKSIPPYSMAVGNPARVIKRFNPETSCWERVKAE